MKGDVIVVDDDPALSASIVAVLTGAGYRVTAYGDAESFVDSIDRRTTGCVLLDINLPDMDGLTALTHVRRLGARLSVLMMTGEADVKRAVAAMKSGASDFIEKPAAPETILAALEAAFRSQSESAPTLASLPLAALTTREEEVMRQLVIGHPNKEIARRLGISPRTVEVHRRNIMSKMNVDNLSRLVRMAVQAGLLDEGASG